MLLLVHHDVTLAVIDVVTMVSACRFGYATKIFQLPVSSDRQLKA